MCGICVFIFKDSVINKDKLHTCIKRSPLVRRGPDAQNSLCTKLTSQCNGLLFGSTLHFRGNLTVQPIQDRTGNSLLWNGEVFDGLAVASEENDGNVISSKLESCTSEEDILNIFGQILGPWAVIYWRASTKQLWFGRDLFGRRSLLYHSEASVFSLSSVSLQDWLPWKEVPAVGVFCAEVTDDSSGPVTRVTLYPWASPQSTATEHKVVSTNSTTPFNKTLLGSPSILEGLEVEKGTLSLIPLIQPFNTMIPESIIPQTSQDILCMENIADDHMKALADELTQVLEKAVSVRTRCQSVLCSQCILSRQGSDQLNVKCSEGVCTTFRSLEVNDNNIELEGQNSNEVSHGTSSCDKQNLSDNLVQPDITGKDQVVRPRTTESTNFEAASSFQQRLSENMEESAYCGHSRVAVLFSGGVDSLVIAALADRSVPAEEPIDLLNVAFEQRASQPQNHGKKHEKDGNCQIKNRDPYSVPDRETGLQGLLQLRAISPGRLWNFVQINISVAELQKIRQEQVRALVYPLTTVLDDSIGCAIWFAARGSGQLILSSGDTVTYTSPARVVLVGMGADEQLAGYSRHRVKYNTEGWAGLVLEIQMEIERISARNLGRDDRVISDHSRESRFPFLDEHVVSFLNKLPIDHKTNLNHPRGIGEKFLLRLAAERMGLRQGAIAPKRAIQFGSRIAKAENRKEKGSDACNRLLD